jgi:hypothetical protein
MKKFPTPTNLFIFQIAKWGIYIPAILSTALLVSQLANTVIFASFAYNFGELYIMLDTYMRETDAMNLAIPNSTNPGQLYRYNGTNAQRINEIDSVSEGLEFLEIRFLGNLRNLMAILSFYQVHQIKCGLHQNNHKKTLVSIRTDRFLSKEHHLL